MSLPNHLLEQLLTICRVPSARDALVEAIKTGGGDLTADEIAYNPTVSGLTATDVQSAIDEVATSSSGAATNLSNLVGPTAINASLIPNSDVTKDLGAVNQSWRKFFAFSWRDNADNTAIQIDSATRQLRNVATVTVLDFSGTNLSVATRKITNLVNPTDPQDAATKNYVDGLVVGATGSFTSQDGKTITVVNGLIATIV